MSLSGVHGSAPCEAGTHSGPCADGPPLPKQSRYRPEADQGIACPTNLHLPPRTAALGSNAERLGDFTQRCLLGIAHSLTAESKNAAFRCRIGDSPADRAQPLLERRGVLRSLAVENSRSLAQSLHRTLADVAGLRAGKPRLDGFLDLAATFGGLELSDHGLDQLAASRIGLGLQERAAAGKRFLQQPDEATRIGRGYSHARQHDALH